MANVVPSGDSEASVIAETSSNFNEPSVKSDAECVPICNSNETKILK